MKIEVDDVVVNEKQYEQLIRNSKDILTNDFQIKESSRVLIIYDRKTQLSIILKNSFENACIELANSYDLIDFENFNLDNFKKDLEWNYKKDDIIILIQSDSFRVSKFRWRNELCSKGLKVLEFGQLKKIMPNEVQTFINSLNYDGPHYQELKNKLIPLIKESNDIKIVSMNNSIARYFGKMDEPVVNDGDFSNRRNKGSRYPIGEIVSEALDLKTLNGEIEVYAYPDLKQETKFVEPFKCVIKDGFLIEHEGDSEFDKIIEMIKTENPKKLVYVREFGVGLNRGIKRFERLGDPISYERQEGLHFSLGMKHGLYEKKLWGEYGRKFYQRYHIDVFVNLKELYIDGVKVYDFKKGFLV